MIDRVGRRVHVGAGSGTSQLSAVLNALSDARIAVDEIALRHPTLDEAFLALTRDRTEGSANRDALEAGSRR